MKCTSCLPATPCCDATNWIRQYCHLANLTLVPSESDDAPHSSQCAAYTQTKFSRSSSLPLQSDFTTPLMTRTGLDWTGLDWTGQHSTAQHSTAQHSTAQHSTAINSKPMDSTAQSSTARCVTRVQGAQLQLTRTKQHASGTMMQLAVSGYVESQYHCTRILCGALHMTQSQKQD